MFIRFSQRFLFAFNGGNKCICDCFKATKCTSILLKEEAFTCDAMLNLIDFMAQFLGKGIYISFALIRI